MYVKVVESFANDGLGSMMRRSNWAYAYDFQEELVQAKSTSPAYTCIYSYDGTGRKVEEVDHMASTYTSYFAYVGSRLAYTYNATSGVKSSFVYLGDQLLFRIDSGSSTAHFYATDLSNNVRLVWNYSTSVTVELKQRYKPLGEAPTGPTTRFTTVLTMKCGSMQAGQGCFRRNSRQEPRFLTGCCWYSVMVDAPVDVVLRR